MTMDDTAGKEKITIHGQYDMDTTVQHDQTNTVNNDFTETIKKNATITIYRGNLEPRREGGHGDLPRQGRGDAEVRQHLGLEGHRQGLDQVERRHHIDSDTKITLVTGRASS